MFAIESTFLVVVVVDIVANKQSMKKINVAKQRGATHLSLQLTGLAEKTKNRQSNQWTLALKEWSSVAVRTNRKRGY